MSEKLLKLKGSNYFRVKIAYSLLFNKAVEITNIRENNINPGLTEYEISFLKLVEKITNGTKIEISKTGTIIKFYPGVITNNYGNEFEYDCHISRCLTYYMEGIIPISMFGKESLNCTLHGITNDNMDISVDTFRSTTCALIQKLVIGDTISLEIKKRGIAPLGGGMVKFKCPIVIFINNFDWIDEGKIKRVRGLAYTSKISASITTRMVDACRGTFNNFLPDVWISVDNYKDKSNQISPGYGISLCAETNNGYFISSDISNNKSDNNELKEISTYDLTPEELTRKCCRNLLEELFYCGAVDTHHQGLFIFLMSLSNNNNISKMKLGRISQHTAGLIRLIHKLLGVKFKIEEIEKDDYDEEIQEENEYEDYEEEHEEITEKQELPNRLLFSCVGVGLKNVARIEI